MELQQFRVVGGDGDHFKDGDVLTIEGVYNLASMTMVERAKHRLSLASRWFARLPSNMRWSIYLRAQRIADWLDPDRER